jgi:ATP-dependent Clp protease ATP-binding subunit ClpC
MAGAVVDVSLPEEGRARDASTLVLEDAGGLRLRVRRRRSDRAAREIQSADDVAALRRFVDRVMHIPSVERVKERIDSLTTQLAAVEGGKKDGRSAVDLGEMFAEHHRLSELWTKADAACADVHSVEELALTALFDGSPTAPLLEEARTASDRFRRALVYLLCALEPERDRITLTLEELDTGAYDLWLPHLLDLLDVRGWEATFHIDGGARTAEDRWPSDRRWGPPRTPAQIRRLLEEPKRKFRNLLLRCQGSYAGSMLSLEQGLHRMNGVGPSNGDGKLCVSVRFIAMHIAMKNEDWALPTFVPPAVETAAARRKGQASREFDVPAETVSLLAKRVTMRGTVASFFGDHELYALEHLLAQEQDEKISREAAVGRRAG